MLQLDLTNIVNKKTSRFEQFHQEFKDKCDSLTEAGDYGKLAKLAYGKGRKAADFAAKAARETDDDQQSYLLKVQRYCLEEEAYANECFARGTEEQVFSALEKETGTELLVCSLAP